MKIARLAADMQCDCHYHVYVSVFQVTSLLAFEALRSPPDHLRCIDLEFDTVPPTSQISFPHSYHLDRDRGCGWALWRHKLSNTRELDTVSRMKHLRTVARPVRTRLTPVSADTSHATIFGKTWAGLYRILLTPVFNQQASESYTEL